MTTMTATPVPAGPATDAGLRRTARTAGLLYLAFFVAGIVGTYLIRSRLFVDGDPAGTLSRLGTREGLARAEIVAELTIAAVQALTALWLYRLFRVVDGFAATSLVLLGMVNATAILGSAAALAAALDVARDRSLGTAGSAAATVQLLYVVSDQLWRAAAVFFGLWLVPMGLLVLRSRWLPALLGRLLLVAGAGYVLSAVVDQLAPDAGTAVALLQLPSVVGELWMTAALLLVGVRGRRPAAAPARPGPGDPALR